MKVSIPQPCSENWDEMNATERGAFCNKCAIDVFDFSNKTANEIKQTLLKNSGKHVCGRFKKTQIEDLGHSYLSWSNQSARTFQSKFLWACLIAFGFTLFTGCSDSMAQNSLPTSYIQVDNNSITTEPDSTKTTTNLPIDDFIIGDIEYSEPEEPMVKGGLMVVEFIKEDSIITICNSNDTLQSKNDSIPTPERDKREPIIMGKIAAPNNFYDYLKEDVKEDVTEDLKEEEIPTEITTNEFLAQTYPNPTKGITTLELTAIADEFFNVTLYDINGQLLTTLHKGFLSKGLHTINIRLTDYSTGIYLIKIDTQNKSETIKINKVGE